MCQHWQALQDRLCSEQTISRIQEAYVALLKDKGNVFKHDVICLTCKSHAPSCQDLQCGHSMVVDLHRMDLYCQECRDVIYNATFDQAMKEVMTLVGLQTNGNLNAEKALNRSIDSVQTSAESELHLSNNQEGMGQLSELQIMKQSRQAAAVDGFPPGLRGLVNLGNTCFMSSVLHALLHAPPLLDFYLGGGHPPATCPHSAQAACLSCELDGVFSAMYCGERKPYSPAAFLAAWWRHSDCLAGYQQQDAHEFYLFALSGLEGSRVITRATPTPSDPSALPSGLYKCKSNSVIDLTPSDSQTAEDDSLGEGSRSVANDDPRRLGGRDRQASPAPRLNSTSSGTEGTKEEGIVERAFEGTLRSDICCAACGYTSTTHEPFLALSMDIDAPKSLPQPLLRPDPTGQTAGGQSPLNKNGKRLVGAALAASNKAAAKKARAEAKAAKLAAAASAQTPSPGCTPPPEEHFSARLSQNNAQDQTFPPGAPQVINGFLMEPGALPSQGNFYAMQGRPAITAAGGPAPAKAPSRPQKGGPKRPRSVRCGECHTCKNKHLKKACLRNAELKKLAESMAMSQHAAANTIFDPLPPGGHSANGFTGTSNTPTPAWISSNHHLSSIGPQPNQPNYLALTNQVPQGLAKEYQPNTNSSYSQGVLLQNAQLMKSQSESSFPPRAVFREEQNNCSGWEMAPTNDLENKPSHDLAAFAPDHKSMGGLPGGSPAVTRGPHNSLSTSLPGQEMPNSNTPSSSADPSSWEPSQSTFTDLAEADGVTGLQKEHSAGHAGQTPRQPKLEESQSCLPTGRSIEQSLQDAKVVKAEQAGPGVDRGTSLGAAGGAGLRQHQVDVDGTLPDLSFLTLPGCLRRYTRPERVAKWTCEACGARCGRKQVSLRTLPQILCFHIKRFRHAGNQGQGQKVESFIRYPERLDMDPFLTTNILQQRFQQPGIASTRSFHTASKSDHETGQTEYELYSVICHRGNIKGGHYVAYLKCDGQWYECDDSWVQAVDAETALNTQAYMLFYRIA